MCVRWRLIYTSARADIKADGRVITFSLSQNSLDEALASFISPKPLRCVRSELADKREMVFLTVAARGSCYAENWRWRSRGCVSMAVRWLMAVSCVACAVIESNEATDSESLSLSLSLSHTHTLSLSSSLSVSFAVCSAGYQSATSADAQNPLPFARLALATTGFSRF